MPIETNKAVLNLKEAAAYRRKAYGNEMWAEARQYFYRKRT